MSIPIAGGEVAGPAGRGRVSATQSEAVKLAYRRNPYFIGDQVHDSLISELDWSWACWRITSCTWITLDRVLQKILHRTRSTPSVNAHVYGLVDGSHRNVVKGVARGQRCQEH